MLPANGSRVPSARSSFRCFVAGMMILSWLLLDRAVAPAFSAPRLGVTGMLEPHTASLLVDYYESFLKDQDIDAFRQNVAARYTGGTLGRLLQSGTPQARRAAVLALGLIGEFEMNATVAKALRDEDPAVRSLAQSALWAIWFRADTPENNATLEQVRELNGRSRFREAEALATRLIANAPRFAEAYNQRAIAICQQQRFAESVEDCKRVLDRNPYHFGALSGMGQCYLQLGRRREALEAFRQALKLQPHSEDLLELVTALEAAEGE